MIQRSRYRNWKCVPRFLSIHHHLTRFDEISNTSAPSFLHSILNCLHKHDFHFFGGHKIDSLCSLAAEDRSEMLEKWLSLTFSGNGPWSCCSHRLELTVKNFAGKLMKLITRNVGFTNCRFIIRLHQKTALTQTVFLCLWFSASLTYINNCPTRCNIKQFIY